MPDDKVKTDGTGDRPFGKLGRSPETGQRARIYALLVGINDYEEPISKLGGCVADVNRVADYLRSQYGDPEHTDVSSIADHASVDVTETHGRLHLRMLTNTEATYDNIIRAGEEHLMQASATGNDSFWFHFSGHGSEQFTATEFLAPRGADGQALPSLAPNGKDQTLVCYNAPDSENDIFLADKELAVLLHRIHTGVRQLEGSQPHILVTLDCCHSGTGTRVGEPGLKTRKYEFLTNTRDRTDLDNPNGSIRALDSYYGDYAGHSAHQANLRIPHTPHLLISGCTNLELAGDKADGGVFTTSLVKALQEAGQAPINYVDLFTWTRAKAKAIRTKQTPQFEPVGNFNPYTAVLEGWNLGGPGPYEVKKKGNRWYVRAGAVNGLPVQSEEKTQLLLFEAQTLAMVGNAEVVNVGVQDSRIELLHAVTVDEAGATQATDTPLELAADTHYVAQIFTLPAAPLYVRVTGDADGVAALLAAWDEQESHDSINLDHLNILPVTDGTTASEPALVAIEVHAQQLDGEIRYAYAFHNLLTGNRWHTIPAKAAEPLEIVRETLQKAAKWHRTLALRNDKSKLQNKYELELLTLTQDKFLDAGQPDPDAARGAFVEAMSVHSATDGRLVIEATDDMLFALDFDVIPYLLRIRTTTAGDDLFFYLFNMLDNGAIEIAEGGEVHIEKSVAGQVVDLGNAIGSIQVSDQEQEAYVWFKLLVTQQPIDIPALTQQGFMKTKAGRLSTFSISSNTDDWHCETVEVKVVRV